MGWRNAYWVSSPLPSGQVFSGCPLAPLARALGPEVRAGPEKGGEVL